MGDNVIEAFKERLVNNYKINKKINMLSKSKTEQKSQASLIS